MGTSTAFVRAVGLPLLLTKRVKDLARAVERLIEAFGLDALDDAELQALTTAFYRRFPTSQTALFDWEQDWFDSDLPPPPGRVLLGGAGLGREQRALRYRGYEVVAFDPAARAGSDVLRLSYEQLPNVGYALDHPSTEQVQAHGPYSAVLFGWGSFTHVPGAERRLAVLRAVRRLSDGPLLMSFWRRSPRYSAGRGRAAGLGKRLARLRGPRSGEDRSGDRIVAHAGYAHTFTRSELEQLAQQAGYTLHYYPHGYAHATLRPVSAPDRS